jgi:hypothetical protein
VTWLTGAAWNDRESGTEEEEEEEEEERGGKRRRRRNAHSCVLLRGGLDILCEHSQGFIRIQMILYSYSNDTIQRSLSYSMRPRQTFYTISGSVRWRTSGPR